jgi:hypothetical protein
MEDIPTGLAIPYDGISRIKKAQLHKPSCAHSPLRIFYYRKLFLREAASIKNRTKSIGGNNAQYFLP